MKGHKSDKIEHVSDKIISASEVGSYLYCSRSWWLRRKQGKQSRNVSEMAQGTRAHEVHGFQVRLNGFVQAVAIICVVLGLLFLIQWFLGG